jgi:hypothetical protein
VLDDDDEDELVEYGIASVLIQEPEPEAEPEPKPGPKPEPKPEPEPEEAEVEIEVEAEVEIFTDSDADVEPKLFPKLDVPVALNAVILGTAIAPPNRFPEPAETVAGPNGRLPPLATIFRF